jgi:hypothetical protein
MVSLNFCFASELSMYTVLTGKVHNPFLSTLAHTQLIFRPRKSHMLATSQLDQSTFTDKHSDTCIFSVSNPSGTKRCLPQQPYIRQVVITTFRPVCDNVRLCKTQCKSSHIVSCQKCNYVVRSSSQLNRT